MAAIKGKDTKPELIVRRGLHARGLRFRLHRRDLPGCPDIVFPSRRVAVFVHGCFWHAHEGCRHFSLPKANRDFWKKKLRGNQKRDNANQTALISAGWKVIVVWECELSGDPQTYLDILAQTIRDRE